MKTKVSGGIKGSLQDVVLLFRVECLNKVHCTGMTTSNLMREGNVLFKS